MATTINVDLTKDGVLRVESGNRRRYFGDPDDLRCFIARNFVEFAQVNVSPEAQPLLYAGQPAKRRSSL